MKFAAIGDGDVYRTKSGGAFNHFTVVQIRNSRQADLAGGYISQSDAVYIATPPDSHLHYARLAARHKKPCLVEKPMARTLEEAGIMASIFQEAGTPLFVAYYRRCLPKFLRVKKIIDSGELGPPLFCHIEHSFPPHEHPVAPVMKGEPLPWRYKPEINGGGNFVDMGTHHLDLCDYFFGPIENVTSSVTNRLGLYMAEDTVMSSFTCGNVNVTGHWNYTGGPNTDSMTIVCESGQMKFSVFNGKFSSLSVYRKTGRYTGDWRKEEFQNPQWVHEPLIKAVAEELSGGAKCPTNWQNGLRAMKAQDRILGNGIASARAA